MLPCTHGLSAILQARRWTPRSCCSPFLREVLPQQIGRCSNQQVGRSGREEARAVQEIQLRRALCRYVSDHGIAAGRSYVSILDTMIVKKISLMAIAIFYYENLTARKFYTRKMFNMKIFRSTVYDAVFQRGESRWRSFALKGRSFEDCST